MTLVAVGVLLSAIHRVVLAPEGWTQVVAEEEATEGAKEEAKGSVSVNLGHRMARVDSVTAAISHTKVVVAVSGGAAWTLVAAAVSMVAVVVVVLAGAAVVLAGAATADGLAIRTARAAAQSFLRRNQLASSAVPARMAK